MSILGYGAWKAGQKVAEEVEENRKEEEEREERLEQTQEAAQQEAIDEANENAKEHLKRKQKQKEEAEKQRQRQQEIMKRKQQDQEKIENVKEDLERQKVIKNLKNYSDFRIDFVGGVKGEFKIKGLRDGIEELYDDKEELKKKMQSLQNEKEQKQAEAKSVLGSVSDAINGALGSATSDEKLRKLKTDLRSVEEKIQEITNRRQKALGQAEKVEKDFQKLVSYAAESGLQNLDGMTVGAVIESVQEQSNDL